MIYCDVSNNQKPNIMKSLQNLSILIWLYSSKLSKKTGKAPIYVRLTIGGRQCQFSLGLSVNPANWDKNANKAKGRGDEIKIINNRIDAVRSKILYHFNHLIAIQDIVTVEDVRNEFLGINNQGKSLLETIDYHNQKLQEKVSIGAVAHGTYKRYKVTKNKVASFILSSYNKSDLFLDEITYQFVVDFEHFLRVKQKIGNNTAMKHIKNLKKILNLAVTHEWMLQNPILNFKCSYQKVHKEVLSKSELHALINKDFEIKRLNEIKDVFLFSCYTGFSYSELESLSPDDVTIGMDGEPWIYKNRKKTGNQERVPLLPIPLEIIDKYKENQECKLNNRLLPVKSNQKYNAYLKEIAGICGINKKLTSHTARHTFATTVLLANNVPLESKRSIRARRYQNYSNLCQNSSIRFE